MNFVEFRYLLAIAAAALVTACGGSGPTDQAAPDAAALMVHVNAPVADCEAEGCNRPRIIDGLAEQYRAGAIAQPAEPVQAGDPGQLAPAPSGAAPGAAVAPQ